MDNAAATLRPKWTFWLSILFLVWNLFGIANFVMQWMMTPADLAKLPAEQQELWGNMAGWIWAAYAVAVGAGTAGALSLVLGRKWAVALLLASVAAIAIQFSPPLVYAWHHGLMGLMAFPAFILAFGLIEWGLARNWAAKGWLG